MKYNVCCLVAIMLFTFVAPSTVVKAQTGDSLNGQLYQQSLSYNVNIGYQLNRQNENALQLKIAALGNTAYTAIFMPVLFGVEVKDIALNFGDMRSTGNPHAGEDIMAIKGTPIVSPTNAVVIRVTTDINSSEGNAVYTANPGGEIFIYYHLSGVGEGVVPGLVLAEGSLIGYVGDTGSAKGTSHLHLEIRNSEGLATNPFTRLTVEFTPAQKISFLKTILTQTSNPLSLSQFLVTNFRSTFTADIQNGIKLPTFILDALAGNQDLDLDASKQQLMAQIKQQIVLLTQQVIQLLQAQISAKVALGQ